VESSKRFAVGTVVQEIKQGFSPCSDSQKIKIEAAEDILNANVVKEQPRSPEAKYPCDILTRFGLFKHDFEQTSMWFSDGKKVRESVSIYN